MKQTARAQLITTPAVRLSVAWMINSMSGLPVRVVRMASGSGMQNNSTMIIERPLQAVSIGLEDLCTNIGTHVTPPIATHISIAIGASRVGRGISSVKWVIASYPISDKLRLLVSDDQPYLSSTLYIQDSFWGGARVRRTVRIISWVILSSQAESILPLTVASQASRPHRPTIQSHS